MRLVNEDQTAHTATAKLHNFRAGAGESFRFIRLADPEHEPARTALGTIRSSEHVAVEEEAMAAHHLLFRESGQFAGQVAKALGKRFVNSH